MARNIIPAFKPNHQVVVGWDRPLQTFFVQVFEVPYVGGDGGPIFEAGNAQYEIPTVGKLQEIVITYADIGWDIANLLNSERTRENEIGGTQVNAIPWLGLLLIAQIPYKQS